jgi:hypothetical protein
MAFNVITSTRDHVKPALLEVCGLRRRFGGVVALDGLGFGVARAYVGALRFAGPHVTGWRPVLPETLRAMSLEVE